MRLALDPLYHTTKTCVVYMYLRRKKKKKENKNKKSFSYLLFCVLLFCSLRVFVCVCGFFLMEMLTSSYPDYIVVSVTDGVHNKERFGRSLIKVASYQGGLSTGWFIIRMVSHLGGQSLIRMVSHQGGLLSEWSLTWVVSLSLGWSLIWNVSQQGGLS